MDTQTLHLVLRPAHSEPAPTGITEPLTQNNTSTIPPPPQFRGAQNLQQHRDIHHAAHAHHTRTERLQQFQREAERLQQELEAVTRAYQSRLINSGTQTPTPPSVTGNPYVPPNANPTSIEQLIAQRHQRRLHGAQNMGGPSNMFTALDEINSHRSAPQFRTPDHSATYTREGVGRNGERWQVTVNETTTTIPFPSPERRNYGQQYPSPPGTNTGNPALDLQNILRNVDRLRAPQAPLPPRASSTPPLAQLENQTPLSSTPAPATTSAPSTPFTTMSPNPAASASVPNLTTTPTTSTTVTSSPSVEPMVYILTSPSGPRALLINNSETFYTPRVPRARHNNGVGGRDLLGLPEYRNRNAQRARVGRGNRPRDNEAAPVEFAPIHNRPQRPGVPIVVQLFNVLWLVVRLVGFVWFFTSGNSSWSRFLMMSGLAIVVFLINTGVFTGVFNGVAEQFWGPIRRHLENLIPLAGPDAALVPAANAAVVPQNGAAEAGTPARLPHGQLDESQVAARILELQRQRQAQPGWLITQIRRAEHAALLFVASLIPGVGERHIAARDNAAREAEAAAAEGERRRVEAENAQNGESGESAEVANGVSDVEQQVERAVEEEDAIAVTTRQNAEVENEVPPAQTLTV